MIEKIRHLRLQQIESVLHKTRLDEIEIESKELRKEVLNLNSEIGESKKLIPYRKFNWFQKYITKRKEYKQYFEETNSISETINQLENKITPIYEKLEQLQAEKRKLNEEVNILSAEERIKWENNLEKCKEAKTLKEMGVGFLDAIEFLEKNNIPVIFTEEDKKIIDQECDYTKLEDLILVHRTNYSPTSSKIKSDKEACATVSSKITLNGKEYEFPVELDRNTVHFAINGEVSEHIEGNAWNSMKYTVMIPFVDVPREQIIAARQEDTYTRGGVNLTDNSWIICPKQEREKIKSQNPEVRVIGYEGENAKDCAPAILSAIGYKAEEIGMHSWLDDFDNEKFRELVVEKENFYSGIHAESKEAQEEELLNNINWVVAAFNVIKNNHLVEKEEDIDQINEQLEEYDVYMGTLGTLSKDELQILYQGLEKFGIEISEENKIGLKEKYESLKKKERIDFVRNMVLSEIQKNKTIEQNRSEDISIEGYE